eukprot:jgi/Botrbrau1/7727/Bobra.0159s0159.1
MCMCMYVLCGCGGAVHEELLWGYATLGPLTFGPYLGQPFTKAAYISIRYISIWSLAI